MNADLLRGSLSSQNSATRKVCGYEGPKNGDNWIWPQVSDVSHARMNRIALLKDQHEVSGDEEQNSKQ